MFIESLSGCFLSKRHPIGCCLSVCVVCLEMAWSNQLLITRFAIQCMQCIMVCSNTLLVHLEKLSALVPPDTGNHRDRVWKFLHVFNTFQKKSLEFLLTWIFFLRKFSQSHLCRDDTGLFYQYTRIDQFLLVQLENITSVSS